MYILRLEQNILRIVFRSLAMVPGNVAVVYGVSVTMVGGEGMVLDSPTGALGVLGMIRKIVEVATRPVSRVSC